jgi:hypothetical protein
VLRDELPNPQHLTQLCLTAFWNVAVQATGDIRSVSLWLGQPSTQITEIHTRVDSTEKLEAIMATTPMTLRKSRLRPKDKLIALLEDKSSWGADVSINPGLLHSSGATLPITTRSPQAGICAGGVP